MILREISTAPGQTMTARAGAGELMMQEVQALLIQMPKSTTKITQKEVRVVTTRIERSQGKILANNFWTR
jgi:hypothetical protein